MHLYAITSFFASTIYFLSHSPLYSCKVFVSIFFVVIFKVYDLDGNGKVAFNDMLDVLRDLTGQFISEQQREVCI